MAQRFEDLPRRKLRLTRLFKGSGQLRRASTMSATKMWRGTRKRSVTAKRRAVVAHQHQVRVGVRGQVFELGGVAPSATVGPKRPFFDFSSYSSPQVS